VIAAGIGLQHTGVDREALALDQPHRHRRPHHALEDVTQQITLAEATQTVLGKRRMVRNLVVEVELAEPPVGQMQLDFLTELALRADAIAVADDEHSDDQFGIDRRPADVAVVGLELLVQVGESHRHEHVHPSQQMVLGDAIFEPKLIEQTALIAPLPPHHRPALRCR
jgi:hypothetical protein